MSDRIGCMNPRCRRTAPAEKYEAGESIICRGCWRMVPPALALRCKDLKRREKNLIRLINRRIEMGSITMGEIERIAQALENQKSANWSEIEASFIAPDKPAGIDQFLSELGIGENHG